MLEYCQALTAVRVPRAEDLRGLASWEKLVEGEVMIP